jgi:hypothetical protein
VDERWPYNSKPAVTLSSVRASVVAQFVAEFMAHGRMAQINAAAANDLTGKSSGSAGIAVVGALPSNKDFRYEYGEHF